MNSAYHTATADRRAGVLLTVLLHAALILGWQALRRPPPPPVEDERPGIQWIRLPAPPARPSPPIPAPVPAPAPAPARAEPVRAHPRGLPSSALPSPSLPTASPGPAPSPAPAPATAPAPNAAQILQQAKRDIGSIDKALRKENRPYIAAPPDSPQIRLRNGIEQAHEMAPNRLWEAPKVEELVNDTGDGARRSRVITGGGTYCVTERSPATSIDMIEKHGKLRITSCPQHEQPATKQEWRTARD
jgi:hypothetical protein